MSWWRLFRQGVHPDEEKHEEMVPVIQEETRAALEEARKETEHIERRIRTLEYQERFERSSRSR